LNTRFDGICAGTAQELMKKDGLLSLSLLKALPACDTQYLVLGMCGIGRHRSQKFYIPA
jgi:hypothetical protein